ncbi:THAP domain-containing protein 6-like [Girardinichthys multiradiatus]|uniref:THAP domain-containing protein 6-like n=1 Tax=Girardinichthys multiradiatus TaxID=208333 RepID=UPI001FAD0212|nr:THAP domain-containing protein 6-like [Girardinichthys multiradiatus]XP_047235932.1 THAP domain-containing protein 6-like [Girardinichthys multiradiatus]XP_047235933.1 THAP domain-containing protein 6-like [Girardinichthys multiradiatus]
MPRTCAAWNCSNRLGVQTKSLGITFHRFPKDSDRRRLWEVAVRRDGFSASSSSALCSEHFKPEDFDRTGQTVRIRDGAIPSFFSFPAHLKKPVSTRTTETSKKAQKVLSVDCSQLVQETDELLPVNVDHCYALPLSSDDLKARLMDALDRVESLERDKRNAMARERRAKNKVCNVLEELRRKSLINDDLKDKLDSYSDLPIDLLSKNSHEFSKDQKEFAITLHLHGPKAYTYLRKSLNINLPHPHTLQRWMGSVDAKPGLNMNLVRVEKKKRARSS